MTIPELQSAIHYFRMMITEQQDIIDNWKDRLKSLQQMSKERYAEEIKDYKIIVNNAKKTLARMVKTQMALKNELKIEYMIKKLENEVLKASVEYESGE